MVATTVEGTRSALGAAVPLARGLSTGLVIVVPRIVTNAAELTDRTESTELMAKRYQEMARALDCEAAIEICVGVGIRGLLESLSATRAPIVVGGPVGRWLTSSEERFANRLVLAGCQVIFVASGANTTQRRVAA